MAFHVTNRETGYELAAINVRTGERFFICHVRGSRSRRVIAEVLNKSLSFGKTRLDLLAGKTGVRPGKWRFAKKAADGCYAGDWVIRFTGRTGLQIDQEGEGPSIYD